MQAACMHDGKACVEGAARTCCRSMCLCSDQAGPQLSASQSWSCAQQPANEGGGMLAGLVWKYLHSIKLMLLRGLASLDAEDTPSSSIWWLQQCACASGLCLAEMRNVHVICAISETCR